MECIQNVNGLKHRHKQTLLEISSYICSDHKPGLLLFYWLLREVNWNVDMKSG